MQLFDYKYILGIISGLFILFSCGENTGAQGSRGYVPSGYEIPYLPGEKTEENTVVEHMGFSLSYNSKLRIPNWVAYELLSTELGGKRNREDHFSPDPLVKGRQAYDSDYKGSGYDRGHMAPAGDMKWSSQAYRESFYLSNVCPQDHLLNKGIWNDLEQHVRYEAKYYKTVWVVCGPVPGTGRKTIGSNKVQVPGSFFKALMVKRKDGSFSAIGFVFPNAATPRGKQIRDYAMSVDDLEKLLGMDLFYSVPYAAQEAAEKKYDLDHWKL